MDKNEIKQKIEEGYIQARFIIEIVGKPKDHVDIALTDLATHMQSNKDVIMIAKHQEAATEHEGELFAAFVEVEVLLKDLTMVVGFCFDYMPSSVEIIEPGEFRIKGREVASFLNEMQAKLHNLGIVIKNLKNENLFLKQNSAILLLNYLTILLVNKKRTIDELSKLTTISKEELKPFLDKLMKENKIKQEGEMYTFAK